MTSHSLNEGLSIEIGEIYKESFFSVVQVVGSALEVSTKGLQIALHIGQEDWKY